MYILLAIALFTINIAVGLNQRLTAAVLVRDEPL